LLWLTAMSQRLAHFAYFGVFVTNNLHWLIGFIILIGYGNGATSCGLPYAIVIVLQSVIQAGWHSLKYCVGQIESIFEHSVGKYELGLHLIHFGLMVWGVIGIQNTLTNDCKQSNPQIQNFFLGSVIYTTITFIASSIIHAIIGCRDMFSLPL